MRVHPIKKGIKPILALFLFFSFTVLVFSQEKQGDENKHLKEEILAVYQAKGDQGLRDFMKKTKNKISKKFIVDFAKAGVKERKEEWLKACQIMVHEKKDEKTLADVYLNMGKYFKCISNFRRANHFYNAAIPLCEKTNYNIGLGIVYQNKAFICLYTGNNIKAMEMYDKALYFFDKSEYSLGLGNVYLGKGLLYFYTGFNEKALEMYAKAFPFFKKTGDNLGLGNILTSKGDIYFYSGNNFAALDSYDKALEYYKNENEPLSCGNIYLSKGKIYLRTGDYSKAIDMYGNAKTFYTIAGSFIGLGNLHKSKGNLYIATSKYKEAIELYDKALIYYEKAGEPRGQASVYLSKGDIYFRTGDNSKAKKMMGKAMEFYEKVGEIRGLGKTHLSIGDIFRFQDDYLRALQMYEKAINYCYKARYLIGVNLAYLKKGEIYFSTGNISKANEYYDKCLCFYEKVGDPRAMGDIYHRKGELSFFSKNYTIALNTFEKALKFYSKGESPGGMGNVYYSMGGIYLKKGLKLKALDMYKRALSYYNKAKALHGQANVYRGMGDVHFKEGNYSEAIKMYDKTLNLSKKIGSLDAEAVDSNKKAIVLAKQGKKVEALVLFEKSIKSLEKVKQKTGISDLQKAFMEKFYEQYEENVLFMLENKYYNKSFKYAESMKSRVFLNLMAEGLVRLDKGLTPELKEKRDNMVSKLSSLNKQIYEAAGGKDEKKLQEIKEQYHKTENEFDELLINIRLENPLYASVRYPQPISVQELQKEVLKQGEILVRYFISPEKLYVFLISKKKFKVVPLDVKKEEIKGLVEEYLRAIKENSSIGMKRYAKILYEKLFKPLEKGIKKSKDIIIIPDRELATIPFESLIVDNKGQDRAVFLLEKYRVKYLQSASLLKILRQQYESNRETNSFIGFGDPVYDYENFKQGKPEKGSMKILATESTESTEGTEDEIKEIYRSRYARAGGIMDRLPASGEEVKTIARLFKEKSQKSVIHLRDKATEENAGKPGMKDFDYIHFTCHGLLNDDFQSLVLSQLPPDKTKEDGYFTLNEIMNCDYNAKLVVLSACQTGSGKLERAEGVTGMTRAVMYAGTPAVAASLWKVDDEATKELMVNFYQNMLEKNLDKAEALRQAKLELIKNKKYRSPLFWSAFVMYGE